MLQYSVNECIYSKRLKLILPRSGSLKLSDREFHNVVYRKLKETHAVVLNACAEKLYTKITRVAPPFRPANEFGVVCIHKFKMLKILYISSLGHRRTMWVFFLKTKLIFSQYKHVRYRM